MSAVPTLSAIHIAFLREHNNLVSKLAELNTTWKDDDEKLYQTARKIVGAYMQHITYTEYLPTVLNDEMRTRFGLEPGSDKYAYNSTENPSVSNAFSTAAFRFGHSLITNHIGLLSEIGNSTVRRAKLMLL